MQRGILIICCKSLGHPFPQQAYYILDGLLDKGLISEREARMIQVIVDRETLKMDVVARDIIRANILKRLLPIINFY